MAQYKAPTPAYNPAAPQYSGMPQIVQFMPYLPNQREMIAAQLQKGFGSGVPEMFGAVGRGNVTPINVLKMREPLSQTMERFGLTFNGEPGGSKLMDKTKFNPSGYQQYGQATGIPYIDQMFGLKYLPGETIPTNVISPPPAPPPAPKKKSTSGSSYSRDRQTGFI